LSLPPGHYLRRRTEQAKEPGEALLTLVREFDAVSRDNYAPLPIAEPE